MHQQAHQSPTTTTGLMCFSQMLWQMKMMRSLIPNWSKRPKQSIVDVSMLLMICCVKIVFICLFNLTTYFHTLSFISYKSGRLLSTVALCHVLSHAQHHPPSPTITPSPTYHCPHHLLSRNITHHRITHHHVTCHCRANSTNNIPCSIACLTKKRRNGKMMILANF